MMRRFRAETGYSIHSYISNKRLLFAHDLLLMGSSVTAACYGCGYKDYSSFSRAYKNSSESHPVKPQKINYRTMSGNFHWLFSLIRRYLLIPAAA
jgi:AraC-like DNA-binding protein